MIFPSQIWNSCPGENQEWCVYSHVMLLKPHCCTSKASSYFSSPAPPQHSSDTTPSLLMNKALNWAVHLQLSLCMLSSGVHLTSCTPECLLPFIGLLGVGHLNDARAALFLAALWNAIYCPHTPGNAAQPAWSKPASDSHASHCALIHNTVTLSNPVCPCASSPLGGSGVIIAVIIVCVLLLAILGSVLYFLYKKGKICGRSGKEDL